MKSFRKAVIIGAGLMVMAVILPARAGTVLQPKISKETQACVACHKGTTPALYQQWGAGKHYRGNVGCYECHGAGTTKANALDHYGSRIHVIVTPKDCGRCHSTEVAQFENSHHAKAAEILGSLDNELAEVVEGNKAFHGRSALLVNGCKQCHGSVVKLKNGQPTVDTWPNDGIGRINVDGSRGSCTACHFRHNFSAAQARQPETCGRCHLGPDHPQKEIYEESRHGIAYFNNKAKMNLDSAKWIVGEDYSAAPTCATCHMSATKTQPATHDIGDRISWNNRPPVSVRPEIPDRKLGLTDVLPWQQRRKNMKDVCAACHSSTYINAFYEQYDGLVTLYDEKFGKPGAKIMKMLKVGHLLTAQPFDEKIEWDWFEIWHHQGRRARMGASMMGPDYTHWHGLYEVAKAWYLDFIPEVKASISAGLKAGGDKAKAAAKLQTYLGTVLASDNHRWFIGKQTAADKAKRAAERARFKARYAAKKK